MPPVRGQMSPTNRTASLLPTCSFDWCSVNQMLPIKNCRKLLIFRNIPCKSTICKGFFYFSVDKPVDSVENLAQKINKFLHYFCSYVNLFSVKFLLFYTPGRFLFFRHFVLALKANNTQCPPPKNRLSFSFKKVDKSLFRVYVAPWGDSPNT